MRIERNRRAFAIAKRLTHDQVGGADHAVGFYIRLRNVIAFDRQAQRFQQFGCALAVGGTIAGWVVRGNLHQFGEEPRLFVAVTGEICFDGFHGLLIHCVLFPVCEGCGLKFSINRNNTLVDTSISASVMASAGL